jgi:hypothetical protein
VFVVRQLNKALERGARRRSDPRERGVGRPVEAAKRAVDV